jgi:hypothetical protein
MCGETPLRLSARYQAWVRALLALQSGAEVDPEHISPLDPTQACKWVTEFFEHSAALLRDVDADAVAAAVTFLVDPGNSDYGPLCVREEVPVDARRRYFESMYMLVHDVFAVRLADAEMGSPHQRALAEVCLNFWTLVPLNTYSVPPGGRAHDATVDTRNIDAVLAVWDKILRMNCEMCVRSVLLAASEADSIPGWSRRLRALADHLYRTGIPLRSLVFDDPESVMSRAPE